MEAKEFNSLLRLIDIGDEDSFEKIYNEYAKKIKSVAFSVLSDTHYAKDVLQNVMIRIWNKSKSFKNIKSPNAFIYTLAKNASIDLYRKVKKRRKRFLSLDKMQEDMDYEIPFETDFSNVEFLSMISYLDDVTQEILIRKLIFRDTHNEIAEDLNLPEGTVKWKYQCGLKEIEKIEKST